MKAFLDTIGLYEMDNTLFDELLVPTDISHSELIDMILFETREMCVTCPSPTIMKRAIKLWCEKNFYYWNKIQETMHYDYNPIENYDRHEEITDTYTHNGTTTDTGTRTIDHTGTDTTEDELKRASYDSSTEQPREKRTVTNTPKTTDTETPDLTHTDSNGGENKHIAYIHGNIGTVTGQDMVKQEREVSEISLYNIIVQSYKTEFCILKY